MSDQHVYAMIPMGHIGSTDTIDGASVLAQKNWLATMLVDHIEPHDDVHQLSRHRPYQHTLGIGRRQRAILPKLHQRRRRGGQSSKLAYTSVLCCLITTWERASANHSIGNHSSNTAK
jgi:hypothetical protein